jgi:hypothetical protein
MARRLTLNANSSLTGDSLIILATKMISWACFLKGSDDGVLQSGWQFLDFVHRLVFWCSLEYQTMDKVEKLSNPRLVLAKLKTVIMNG